VPWSAKKARNGQPDLDYMAPEVQLETAFYATTSCDMFAFGSLICALYNSGNTPIRAGYNLSTYAIHAKQVPDDDVALLVNEKLMSIDKLICDMFTNEINLFNNFL